MAWERVALRLGKTVLADQKAPASRSRGRHKAIRFQTGGKLRPVFLPLLILVFHQEKVPVHGDFCFQPEKGRGGEFPQLFLPLPLRLEQQRPDGDRGKQRHKQKGDPHGPVFPQGEGSRGRGDRRTRRAGRRAHRGPRGGGIRLLQHLTARGIVLRGKLLPERENGILV